MDKVGFIQTELLIKLDLVTGVDFELQEYLYFNSFHFGKLRTKTKSDGISSPTFVQNIIQRFGPYVASGILHDGAFRMKLERQDADGAWLPFMVDDKDDSRANILIDEALKSENCSWLEREVIYHMLQLFGWKAFDEDRTQVNKPSQDDLAKLIKPL